MIYVKLFFFTFPNPYSWSSSLPLNCLLRVPPAEDGGAVEGAAGGMAGPRPPVHSPPSSQEPLNGWGRLTVPARGGERGSLCPSSAVCALSFETGASGAEKYYARSRRKMFLCICTWEIRATVCACVCVCKPALPQKISMCSLILHDYF